MSDIFTLKTVNLTPELGMALKNFRIENKVTAKSITEKFKRASSYVSKLEKGDIKKIEGDALIQLCNFITGTDDGLKTFLCRLANNYTEFSDETKIIIMNIDDLLLEFPISNQFLSDINSYMTEHNISVNELCDKINQNEDIIDRKDYKDIPNNVWCDKDNDIDKAFIKLNIPLSYLDDLLDDKIQSIHRVIVEAILYALYNLGGEEDPHRLALEKLDIYHFLPYRRVIKTSSNKPRSINDFYKSLEPDTAESLYETISGLIVITSATKSYGSKKIKQITQNMKQDLGFAFAFMSTDIVELEKKDKEKKQQFLIELKELVKKYSQEDTNADQYDMYE